MKRSSPGARVPSSPLYWSSLYPRSRLGTGIWWWPGGRQPRTASSGRRTDRGYRRTLKMLDVGTEGWGEAISILPVTGASSSIIVFSALSSAAPSLMIFKAVCSSSLPSRMKCCFRTSGLGLLVLESNTSAMVSLLEGGNGTPRKQVHSYSKNNILINLHVMLILCN